MYNIPACDGTSKYIIRAHSSQQPDPDLNQMIQFAFSELMYFKISLKLRYFMDTLVKSCRKTPLLR